MLLTKKMMLLVMTALLAGFTSCSKDDDDEIDPINDPIDDPNPIEIASFNLPDQPLSEGEISVANLKMFEDGWLVARRDDGDEAPDFSEIISIPEYVEAGDYSEYVFDLQEDVDLKQGEKLWVNLHEDNGDKVFSYNDSSDVDKPLGYFDLSWGYILIAHSFIVDLPQPTGSVFVEDQVIDQERTIMIDSVNNSHPAWLVIYQDENGEPLMSQKLSIPQYVAAGDHTNIQASLEVNADITSNELMWIVLHVDDGDKIFEKNIDAPLIDASNEIVSDSFSISFPWYTGSLTVSDQILNENRSVTISSIEMEHSGWLVLHENTDGAPLTTEVITEPVFLEDGTHEDVDLQLKEEFEVVHVEQIWAALYSDDGDMLYEYDGTGEVDPPFKDQYGTPVTEKFKVYTESSTEYFLLFIYPNPGADISAIPLFENEPGWLVVHRLNGTAFSILSEVVSVPKFLEAGASYAHLSFREGLNISDQEILQIALYKDDGDGVFEPFNMWDYDSLAIDENGEAITQPFQLSGLSFF